MVFSQFFDQPSITTLNSRKYTNKISLFLFLLHMVAAIGLVGFLLFRGVQGQIEASYNKVKRAEKRVLEVFSATIRSCISFKHCSCICMAKGSEAMAQVFCSLHTMDHFCHVSIYRNSANLLPNASHRWRCSLLYCICDRQWLIRLLDHTADRIL
ncbi:hypothetical protein EV1_039355 [Malus domestica]